MPVGHIATMLVLTAGIGFALASPHPTESRPFRWSFLFAAVVNELPFAAFLLIVASTALAATDDGLSTVGAVVAVTWAAVDTIGLALIARRALRLPRRRPWPRSRWLRILLWPVPWWPPSPGARRTRNLGDGPHRLDLYQPTRVPPTGDLVIHLHAGGFRIGRKNRDGRVLIDRLVRQGWTGISANYRLRAAAVFPDVLDDVHAAVAWARANLEPRRIVLAGSSAGANLAATAGLSDPAIAGVIGFYGYYGPIATRGPASSPHDHVHAGAPPFAVVHGDQDTLTIVEDARAFADALRAVSRRPVVYVELAGGHHNLDRFHSIRCHAAIDELEATFLPLLPSPAPQVTGPTRGPA